MSPQYSLEPCTFSRPRSAPRRIPDFRRVLVLGVLAPRGVFLGTCIAFHPRSAPRRIPGSSLAEMVLTVACTRRGTDTFSRPKSDTGHSPVTFYRPFCVLSICRKKIIGSGSHRRRTPGPMCRNYACLPDGAAACTALQARGAVIRGTDEDGGRSVGDGFCRYTITSTRARGEK